MRPVVVAILDRDDWGANTDIIVHVDPQAKRLTWIPRDLWSPLLGDRINAAVAKGGPRLLARALRQLGFACDGALCLRRAATEGLSATMRVTVPVKARLDLWYPLTPTQPIEAGRKQITFEPPEELLEGERLHQWVGARYVVNGAGSDLYRLERQQILLRALLQQGFNFSLVLRNPALIRTTGDPLPTLRAVRRRWKLRTYAGLRGETIGGKQVLVPTDPLPPIPPAWRRALSRLLRR